MVADPLVFMFLNSKTAVKFSKNSEATFTLKVSYEPPVHLNVIPIFARPD